MNLFIHYLIFFISQVVQNGYGIFSRGFLSAGDQQCPLHTGEGLPPPDIDHLGIQLNFLAKDGRRIFDFFGQDCRTVMIVLYV